MDVILVQEARLRLLVLTYRQPPSINIVHVGDERIHTCTVLYCTVLYTCRVLYAELPMILTDCDEWHLKGGAGPSTSK